MYSKKNKQQVQKHTTHMYNEHQAFDVHTWADAWMKREQNIPLKTWRDTFPSFALADRSSVAQQR